MKKYIAPAIVVVDVNVEAVMFGTSNFGVSNQTAQSEDEFAAPEYRTSLWND